MAGRVRGTSGGRAATAPLSPLHHLFSPPLPRPPALLLFSPRFHVFTLSEVRPSDPYQTRARSSIERNEPLGRARATAAP